MELWNRLYPHLSLPLSLSFFFFSSLVLTQPRFLSLNACLRLLCEILTMPGECYPAFLSFSFSLSFYLKHVTRHPFCTSVYELWDYFAWCECAAAKSGGLWSFRWRCFIKDCLCSSASRFSSCAVLLLLSFPVAVIMQERVLMITHTDRQPHTHAPCALSGLSHYYVIGF